jgi:hypothetical protein
MLLSDIQPFYMYNELMQTISHLAFPSPFATALGSLLVGFS